MKKKLAFASALAVLAAFFASEHPDGLDKTALTLGFAGKAREHWAPMSDYKLAFLGGGVFSTACAALIGLLLVYALLALGSKRKTERQETSN